MATDSEGTPMGPLALAKKAPKPMACAVTGEERPRWNLVQLEELRPSLAERIKADHPDLAPESLISRAELARYRTLYVEELLKAEHGELTELDRQVAESLEQLFDIERAV